MAAARSSSRDNTMASAMVRYPMTPAGAMVVNSTRVISLSAVSMLPLPPSVVAPRYSAMPMYKP